MAAKRRRFGRNRNVERAIPASGPRGVPWATVRDAYEQVETEFYRDHPNRDSLYEDDITVHIIKGKIVMRYRRNGEPGHA